MIQATGKGSNHGKTAEIFFLKNSGCSLPAIGISSKWDTFVPTGGLHATTIGTWERTWTKICSDVLQALPRPLTALL